MTADSLLQMPRIIAHFEHLEQGLQDVPVLPELHEQRSENSDYHQATALFIDKYSCNAHSI